MKSLQLVFLFVVGALFLSQICHAAEDSTATAVTIVSATAETKAVDANNDGKVTLGECMASAKQLFPDETAEKHAAIAKGCLLFIQQQQTPGWSPTGEKNNADALMAQMWAERVPRGFTIVTIVTITPEVKAVDVNNDGKVTLDECMASAKNLFPEETAENHAAIAQGCLLFFQQQQAPGSSPTVVQKDTQYRFVQVWLNRFLVLTIVSVTPEAEAVDVNRDGKVTLGECMASAQQLFPEETAEKHAAIAKGCLKYLQEQQAPGSSPTGAKNNTDDLMAQMWSKRVRGYIGVQVTFSTPETKAVDVNRDGKVSINECMASAKRLFPDETAEKQAAIAQGCLLSLQQQQVPGSFTTSLQNSADILMAQTWAERVLSSASVVIFYITPEANAVDVNNDGKVTLDECLESAKNLFPEETAANHAAIAKGCLSFLEQQQTPGWSPTGEQNDADALMTQMWAQRVLRTAVVLIVSPTPEIDAMDTNGDGKISVGECEEACRLLFPDESRDVLDAIIKGCMSSLQKQQDDVEQQKEPEPKPVEPTVQPDGNSSATGSGPQQTQTTEPTIKPTTDEEKIINDGDIPKPVPPPGVEPPPCNSTCCGDNCPTPVMAQTFMERLRQRLHTLPGSIKKVREDYISSRWLLTKAREYKKALLATIPFVFVPLYLMGCFTRFHLYVGSVIETGKNLFNFSGKEGREAYLLWSITVAALITVVEAFGLFPPVAAKLVQARDKLGFQQTNWAQFFQNSSHLAHALTWLFMTSATVRRMRSTGYSVYVLVPFFLMAFSVDINDVLDEVYHVNVTTGHYTVTTYLLNAIKYIGTIGYSVVFTAGIAILLFVIPEAEEIIPDESGQVNIVQSHISESGQFFSVATIPPGVVKTVKLLSMGSERAENLVPAILSFFFHGVGYLFQGRFFKFVFTLTASFAIWYDFYALHVVGTTVGQFSQGWLDLKTNATATHNVLLALKAVAEQDHPKLGSLYWHTLIFFTFHLASTLDVLSYKRSKKVAA